MKYEIRMAIAVVVDAASADEAGTIAEGLQQIESFGGHRITGTAGTAWVARVNLEQAAPKQDGEQDAGVRA